MSSATLSLPFFEMNNETSPLSEVSIIRRLSESKYPVYLAKNSRTNKLVATKAFPLNTLTAKKIL